LLFAFALKNCLAALFATPRSPHLFDIVFCSLDGIEKPGIEFSVENDKATTVARMIQLSIVNLWKMLRLFIASLCSIKRFGGGLDRRRALRWSTAAAKSI